MTAEQRKRGRPPNVVSSAELTLQISKGMKAYLRQLCSTHLYGKTEGEVAELILSQEIKRLVISGELETLLARRPILINEPAEEDDSP